MFFISSVFFKRFFQAVIDLLVYKIMHMHIYIIVFFVINFIVIFKFNLHFYNNVEVLVFYLKNMSKYNLPT